jgi:hypothetical protein
MLPIHMVATMMAMMTAAVVTTTMMTAAAARPMAIPVIAWRSQRMRWRRPATVKH